MDINQVRRIMAKGFSVVIKNELTGSEERFTPASNGKWVVSSKVDGSGHTTMSEVSMTEAYEKLSNIETANAVINHRAQKLVLSKVGRAV